MMTHPNLTIRVTTAADVSAIQAMSVNVGVFSPEEVATVDELLDAYFTQGATLSGYHFLSAVSVETNAESTPETVVGFACYGPRALTVGAYDLYWIVTAPNAARQGVGGQLLEAVEEAVRSQQGRIIVAETSGREDYVNTRHFYAKYNYLLEAQLRDFYAPGDDLVLFIRRLPTSLQELPQEL